MKNCNKLDQEPSASQKEEENSWVKIYAYNTNYNKNHILNISVTSSAQ